ncbi:glycosyltransferase [Escherichia coli]
MRTLFVALGECWRIGRRNRGLEVATVKYVAFVDADDEVYPTMQTLMTMALEDDLDVAQ